MSATMARHRPIGVTILAILGALAAIFAIWHTLQYLGIMPVVLGQLKFYGVDLLGAFLWAVSAAIWIWVVVNLWRVNPQGWMFVVILSALNLVLDFFSILGKSDLAALWPSILVNGIALIYCLTPGVRQAFGTETV
jgi:hypothetical protein